MSQSVDAAEVLQCDSCPVSAYVRKASSTACLSSGKCFVKFENKRWTLMPSVSSASFRTIEAAVIRLLWPNGSGNGAAAKKTMISKPASSAAAVHRMVLPCLRAELPFFQEQPVDFLEMLIAGYDRQRVLPSDCRDPNVIFR